MANCLNNYASYVRRYVTAAPKNVKNMPQWVWNIAGNAQKFAVSVLKYACKWRMLNYEGVRGMSLIPL
jgi:hypothetical protein